MNFNTRWILFTLVASVLPATLGSAASGFGLSSCGMLLQRGPAAFVPNDYRPETGGPAPYHPEVYTPKVYVPKIKEPVVYRAGMAGGKTYGTWETGRQPTGPQSELSEGQQRAKAALESQVRATEFAAMTWPFPSDFGYIAGGVPGGYLAGRGLAIRRGFRGHGLFTPTWFGSHRSAWHPAVGWPGAWQSARAASILNWYAWEGDPIFYDMGATQTQQRATRKFDWGSLDIVSVANEYKAAKELASRGSIEPKADSQWFPLGVFALVRENEDEAQMIFQIAMNKNGMVRGNYHNSFSNSDHVIHGAVDSKTQKIAWMIGDNDTNVISTGVFNLTQEESFAQIFFGPEKMNRWMLVRLEETQEEDSDAAPAK